MSTPTKAKSLDLIDKTTFLHPFTDLAAHASQGGRMVTSAEHIYIRDADGNLLLDGMSGLWCTNLGYTQPKIIEAIADQLHTLPYYNSFFNCTTDTTVAMADALVSVLPENFNRVFFTNSGSEANDTNIRIAHRYFDLLDKPQKKIIISRKNAYHGSTIAGASLSGMSNMHAQTPLLGYVHHVEQPYLFEISADMDADEFGRTCAGSLADKIDELGAENVAAFIAEPIQGAGGVVIPPDSYWPEVQRICRDRDVLIISDEVICGFGRTGSWFGCQTYGYEPDLITFAKAVTNGYQPLGGVGVSQKISEVITDRGGEFAHGFTYSGHPVACAAGIATLDIYQSTALVDTVKESVSPYWMKRWDELISHPIVGEARSKGMLGALELVREKPARTRLDEDSQAAVFCRDMAVSNGLMVRQVGDAIISAPPLICDHREIDILIERLLKALDVTASHYGINSGSALRT